MPELAAGADHPHGDLAAVGDQELVGRPWRLALLEERRQPLLPLGAGAHARRSARPGRAAPATGCVTHQPLGLGDRRRAAAQRSRPPRRPRRRRARSAVDDPVHEADLERLGRSEPAAADEQLARAARADRAQHVGRDHGRDQAQPRLGEAEGGGVDGDRDVGAGDEPGAAAEGVAVDARDHRLGAGVDASRTSQRRRRRPRSAPPRGRGWRASTPCRRRPRRRARARQHQHARVVAPRAPRRPR